MSGSWFAFTSRIIWIHFISLNTATFKYSKILQFPRPFQRMPFKLSQIKKGFISKVQIEEKTFLHNYATLLRQFQHTIKSLIRPSRYRQLSSWPFFMTPPLWQSGLEFPFIGREWGGAPLWDPACERPFFIQLCRPNMEWPQYVAQTYSTAAWEHPYRRLSQT